MTLPEIIPVIGMPPEGGYPFIPRISIQHASATLTYNDVELDAAQMKHLIFLGGARHRNMFNWSDDPSERGLECESKDFEHGLPTEKFPWELSNLDPTRYEPDEHGQVTIGCGSCIFNEWVKDPSAPKGSRPPRCYEQVAGLFLVPTGSPNEHSVGIEYRLGVLVFQKSSLKPVNEYLKTFTMKKRAPYETLTSMRLNKNLGKGAQGDFGFSVPSFTTYREVDSDMYPVLSRILRAGRESLSQPTPKPAPRADNFFGVPLSTEDKGERYTGTFF